jgi:hypothetical protein
MNDEKWHTAVLARACLLNRTRGWTGPLPVTKQFLLAPAGNGKSRLANFQNYLSQNGIELRQPKEWELLRFAHSNGVGIIYFKANGTLTWSPEAHEAWLDHRDGIACRFAAQAQTANISYDRKKLLKELMVRDGPNCVVCNRPLSLGTASLEHLLDRKFGGPEHIANLTLACKPCNMELGKVKTLREKIEIIVQKRSLPCTS